MYGTVKLILLAADLKDVNAITCSLAETAVPQLDWRHVGHPNMTPWPPTRPIF